MRNLNLSPYKITVPAPENPSGSRDVDYSVRDSVVNILFNPELKLSGVDLLRQDDLARKVESAEGGAVLLEEAEYLRIRQAVESFHGFDRFSVEFVRRVLDCPEVKVTVA